MRVGLILLLLAGCAPGPPREARENGPAFDPIEFFTGPTRGRGTVDQLVGADKNLAVESQGRRRAMHLIVDQQIMLDDQPPRRRRWVLRRAGDAFAGSLTDASGPVRVEAIGSTIRIRYPMDGMRVEQWLAARIGGCSLDNRLSVTRFGIELARVTEVIVKPPPCAPRDAR